jgi:hypothetical protein
LEFILGALFCTAQNGLEFVMAGSLAPMYVFQFVYVPGDTALSGI